MNSDDLFGPRRSIRLPGFHYAETGTYFLTICTYQKKFLFGQVHNDGVELTALGQIVAECWATLPQHFPHVEVPAHVVMPNHLHGIVILHAGVRRERERPEAFQKPVAGSVPTLARSFKAAVTLRAKRAGVEPPHPVWQRNYFEHLLRDGKEYTAATRYILENPLRWQFDGENPEGPGIKRRAPLQGHDMSCPYHQGAKKTSRA